MEDRPDGIIITIGSAWLKERGVRNWYKDFMQAMTCEDGTYWIRQGTKPQYEVMYVYLCIGGLIRYRCNVVGYYGEETVEFSDGSTMSAKAWVVVTSPMVKAPHRIEWKGFQGFRYTHKLF